MRVGRAPQSDQNQNFGLEFLQTYLIGKLLMSVTRFKAFGDIVWMYSIREEKHSNQNRSERFLLQGKSISLFALQLLRINP